MKKRFNILTTIMLAGAMLSVSSCLKDASHTIDFAGSIATVELPLSAPSDVSTGPFVVESLAISNTPTVLPLIVNLASPTTSSTAVTVTLALDPNDLAAYNTADSIADIASNTPYVPFTLLPAADYSISNLTVTIPAGQRTATVKISINTSLVDPSGAFILPLKIVKSSVAINQFNYILYDVQAKNIYDGQYTVNGTMNDLASATITGDYPINYYLETQGANTDALFDYVYSGGFGHEILSSGNTSYFGSFSPLFTFDASGNITNVTNYYGQVSGPHGRSAILDPTGQNKFISGTPGTVGSVFQVSYILVAADYGGNEVFFNETYTYDGPRP